MPVGKRLVKHFPTFPIIARLHLASSVAPAAETATGSTVQTRVFPHHSNPTGLPSHVTDVGLSASAWNLTVTMRLPPRSPMRRPIVKRVELPSHFTASMVRATAAPPLR